MVCSYCKQKNISYSHKRPSCPDLLSGNPSYEDLEKAKKADEEKEKERKEAEETKKRKEAEEREKLKEENKELKEKNTELNAIIIINKYNANIKSFIKENDHIKLDPTTKNKLKTKLHTLCIKKLENNKISDPGNNIYDEITNKFLRKKFKHSDGRVCISDMITVMTKEYMSKLFPDNYEICKDFVAILESFEADDGYIKE
jgi:predicted RNase H-like nuclease (RuvC/YqgF family)